MIVTPRKLQIDLPLGYAFALIARVYPKVDAFKFLKRVEGIQKIHHLVAFVTGMVCFGLQLSPLWIAVWTIGVTLLFYLFRFFGIFFIPGLVFVSTAYSYLTSFGIFTIALIAVGWWRTGIWGVVAFFAARLLAELITMFFDGKAGEKLGAKMDVNPVLAKAGSMYLAPIKDFVNAYRLFADSYGLTRDVEVSDEELRFENWKNVWEDFENKWPEIAGRYDENPYKYL